MKDPRRLKNDPDRCYRVALLRADEAAQLTRDAENEYADGCKHLDVFHRQGRATNGSTWRSCTVRGCGYTEITGPDPLVAVEAEQDRREARAKRFDFMMACLFAGGLLGYLIGWLT